MPTISSALTKVTALLAPLYDSARLDAEVLLSHVLKKSRTYLYTWPEQALDADQLQQFEALVQQRLNGEPIAYLTGMREFWSLSLEVNHATLIPRPETELLVERALARIPEHVHWDLLDLGTGSGAIALALASERPECRITAIEQSDTALEVARRNARRLGITNVTFVMGDWFTPLHTSMHQQRFQLIVSNPPYIAQHDPHLLQGDVQFEPLSALTSGSDGLTDIRQLITGAQAHLESGGWLLLEHGYNQCESVEKLLALQGFKSIYHYLDIHGHCRISEAQN